MKLIIGLGNPGNNYKNTRHNIGFMSVEKLAEKHGISLKFESKFNAFVGKGSICGKDVFLVEPMTYMNLSGESIVKVVNWYKLQKENIFIIFDDISLDLGRLRFRNSGSDGGHNGIKSIINCFGGFNSFHRLKVGIGPDPGGHARSNFVLEPFASSEKALLNKVIEGTVEATELYLKNDINTASNHFNGIDFRITES